jgi:hypothetical protein
MVFADQLERLRAALSEGQRGMRGNVIVKTEDLQELLYHFERLDREVRATDYARAAVRNRA